MKEFILPNKWCIKVTEENSLIVGKHFGIMGESYKDWYKRGRIFSKYLRSHNDAKESVSLSALHSFSSNKPEGLELTTEEFEKYVLGNISKENNIQVKEDTNYLIDFFKQHNII